MELGAWGSRPCLRKTRAQAEVARVAQEVLRAGCKRPSQPWDPVWNFYTLAFYCFHYESNNSCYRRVKDVILRII